MFYEKVEALAKEALTNMCNATSEIERNHHGGQVAAYVTVIAMATGENGPDILNKLIDANL